jgi:hypothetical protein
MAFGVGRALTAPLAVINFILYLISIVLAGWAINKSIEGEYIGGMIFSSKPSFQAYKIHQLVAKKEHEFGETCGLVVIDSVVCLFVVVLLLRVVARVITAGGKNERWWCLHAGNAATQFFLPLAIIAAVVGLASTLAGFYHLRVYRTDTLSAAHAAALIALLLTLLGLG